MTFFFHFKPLFFFLVLNFGTKKISSKEALPGKMYYICYIATAIVQLFFTRSIKFSLPELFDLELRSFVVDSTL